MKRFNVPCKFGDTKAPFHIYIGNPGGDVHPLFFQQAWLKEQRGGVIPQEVMDSFSKLVVISRQNNVSFEDLCVYALGTAAKNNEHAKEIAQKQAEKLKEQPTEIENISWVKILASSNELKNNFEDDFNLLHIQYKQIEIYQIVMLVRSQKTKILDASTKEGNITIGEIVQYGIVEYYSIGLEIPTDALTKIFNKYKLKV